MARFHVHKSTLKGELRIPPSKSHTLRALLFGMMAQGTTHIKNFLPSPDTAAMIHAISLLGSQVKIDANRLLIQGVNGKLRPADDVISCGNSGQILRFIGALSALLPSYTVLTGDPSIRQQRPAQPLIDGLTQLGAFAASSRLDGYAPLIIQGPLKGGTAFLSGEDSQPVSGLLMAAAFATAPTELKISHPGEKSWVALTLHWFDRLGISYRNHQFEQYQIPGNSSIQGFEYTVPGDFSSAAFPLAAALITDSEITLHDLDLTDSQGDKALIFLLQKMGARLEIDAEKKTITVRKGTRLKGLKVDLNEFVDALPILAVLGCFAEGETELWNGAIARQKESDRIHCIAHELQKMGADIEERPDGLLIRPSPLKGAHLETYHDHRLVLALSVAALAAEGPSSLSGVECAAKTYPTFCQDFKALGANIEALT